MGWILYLAKGGTGN